MSLKNGNEKEGERKEIDRRIKGGQETEKETIKKGSKRARKKKS